MKALRKLVLVVFIVVVGLIVARNMIAKIAVTKGVRAVTGVGVDVDKINIGLFDTRLGVQGLKILNPPGFPEPIMVLLPELYVDYELGSFLKGQPHLQTVRIELAELVVIRNDQGEVNINSLRPVKEQRQAQGRPTGEQKPTTSQKQPQLKIDLLELKVGRVIFKDYSKGGAPQVKQFDVNINERFNDITNPQALVSTILMKALSRTSIAQLANVDLGALKASAAEGAIGAASDALKSAVGEKGAAALKGLFSGNRSKQEQ